MTYDVETLPRGRCWSVDTTTSNRQRAIDRRNELLRRRQIARVMTRDGRVVEDKRNA